MSEWVTRLPYYAFATYYPKNNPYTVPHKADVQNWVYHFKQKWGPHRGEMTFSLERFQPFTGSTFAKAAAFLKFQAERRKSRVAQALNNIPIGEGCILVPLPSSSALTLADHVGGAGRVAEVLAKSGYGRVMDGLRWRTAPRSATSSNPSNRPPAGEKFENLVWVGNQRPDFWDVVILVDDVVSYGDTSMAAANRLRQNLNVLADGVIAVGRTNGGQQPDALDERVGEITATPVAGSTTWRASLDGTSS